MHKLFRGVAVASALTLALTGCAQKSTGGSNTTVPAGQASGSAVSGQVNVLLSGDTNVQELWQKSIIPSFEKANPGVKVNLTLDLHGEHDSQNLAKLTAAEQAGKDAGMDLIDAGFVAQAAQAGLLEKADAGSIANLRGVPEDLIKAGMGGGIPYRGSSVLLAYDSEKVKNPPKSLDELLTWIKANKGQFTYNIPSKGGSGGAFVTTVLDKNLDKATADKMRTGYDQSLQSAWDKGFDELRSLNPYIYNNGTYSNGNKQSLEFLTSGQIQMTPVWSDQYLSGIKSGSVPGKIKATQITGPSFTGGAAYLGVPKNASNKALALKLANHVLGAESQTAVVNTIAGYPVIPLDQMPKEVQDTFKDAHPEVLRPTYFGKVQNDMNAAWDQKVPGK